MFNRLEGGRRGRFLLVGRGRGRYKRLVGRGGRRFPRIGDARDSAAEDGAAMGFLKTVTLGCKVNQYETEQVRQALLGVGWQDAADDGTADLCVVNTCTVTGEGDAQSRKLVRKLARRHPEARIMVMGCYATRAPEEVAALPNVVEVLTDKREIPDWLQRTGVVDVPRGLTRFGDRQRAYVKVQDGCLLRCSYCIIPHVRPEMSSRPADDIVAEVRDLVEIGRHQEIVLTGIHLGHYGVDRNRGLPKAEWVRLSHLLERLVTLPGDFRVRLSSIEATEVTPELLRVMAAHPTRICPHLHVCLQSGSEDVLRRMRRRWGAKRFVDRCAEAVRVLPKPALTTDVIVGFPGETEADFAATLAVCEEVGFCRIHAFPFSARRGTPAAEFPDPVPDPLKKERIGRLRELETRLAMRYAATLVGERIEVLIEGPSTTRPDCVTGTSCRFLPTDLPGPPEWKRQAVRAVVTGIAPAEGEGPAARWLARPLEAFPTGPATIAETF